MSRVTISVSPWSAKASCDALIVPVYKGKQIATALPKAIERLVKEHMRKLEFAGHWGSAELVASPAGRNATFLALVGLGKKDASISETTESLRRGLGKILQDCRKHALRDVGILLPDAHVQELTSAASEVAEIVAYRFSDLRSELKKEQEKRSLKKMRLFVSAEHVRSVRKTVEQTRVVTDGIETARLLVDKPASHASPEALVETARSIAKQSKQISLEVFDKKEARKRNFNAFLAVASGSTQEPYVIHLKYSNPKAKRKIALVGKGITFDSGGLSLKPAQQMEDMKIDMAGAAVVLGVFSVLAKFNIPVEVHGIIAACENMPSGSAYRPGDVVQAMNGKTIEILNTDAEGRVTLADTLTYACKQGVDTVVDMATLTGAAMVGLGETHAGLWSNSKSLQRNLLKAASIAGEGLTAMPLPPEYRQLIQSNIADVANVAKSPMGGAITAALFLREFVTGVEWAHIDLAGPVYASKPLLPYFAQGATGYGVRTMVNFLQTASQAESQHVQD